MKEMIVGENEAGQRLDKLLGRYLRQAPAGFLYKMLRKKNITLNGKKATGGEKTAAGDVIRLYLSDDTYRKFSGPAETEPANKAAGARPLWDGVPPLSSDAVVYEDKHILIVNKPTGVLSQKSRPEDVSMNEQILSYLLRKGELTAGELMRYPPSVCNRLDRNTSGLLIAGKTLAGLQTMSRILQDRSLHKYYLCLVEGKLTEKKRLEGVLEKDAVSNTVRVRAAAPGHPSAGKPIVTEYTPLCTDGKTTLLEVWLITGRSHQIRAHLASVGHPIIGDRKYGSPAVNDDYCRRFGVRSQLLHAHRMVMPPRIEGALSCLSGREFTAPAPPVFDKILHYGG